MRSPEAGRATPPGTGPRCRSEQEAGGGGAAGNRFAGLRGRRPDRERSEPSGVAGCVATRRLVPESSLRSRSGLRSLARMEGGRVIVMKPDGDLVRVSFAGAPCPIGSRASSLQQGSEPRSCAGPVRPRTRDAAKVRPRSRRVPGNAVAGSFASKLAPTGERPFEWVLERACSRTQGRMRSTGAATRGPAGRAVSRRPPGPQARPRGGELDPAGDNL